MSDCQCGRDINRKHCPYCGQANFYTYKQPIPAIHPLSGEMIENVTVTHCRGCNKDFHDLQWQFECKAPPSARAQQAQVKAQTKEDLMFRAKNGEKFDENDRRHFRKIVGISYNDFMLMWHNATKGLQP